MKEHRRTRVGQKVSLVASSLAPVRKASQRGLYTERPYRTQGERAIWPGTATLLEGLVLLVLVVGSVAVIMGLNAHAYEISTANRNLQNALILTSNSAEQFASDPEGALETTASVDLAKSDVAYDDVVYEDKLVIVRDVSVEEGSAGNMYRATITAWNAEDVVSVVASRTIQGKYNVTVVNPDVQPVYTLNTAAYLSHGQADERRVLREKVSTLEDALDTEDVEAAEAVEATEDAEGDEA